MKSVLYRLFLPFTFILLTLIIGIAHADTLCPAMLSSFNSADNFNILSKGYCLDVNSGVVNIVPKTLDSLTPLNYCANASILTDSACPHDVVMGGKLSALQAKDSGTYYDWLPLLTYPNLFTTEYVDDHSVVVDWSKEEDRIHTGTYIFSFWGFLNETKSIKITGRVDDTLRMQIYHLSQTLDLGSPVFDKTATCDGSSSDCSSGDPAHNTGIFDSGISPLLNPGWYYVKMTYTDLGGNDFLEAHLNTCNGVGTCTVKPATQIFSLTSTNNPAYFDGDTSANYCINGSMGATHDWTNDNVPAQRKCCGDDPADNGYYDSIANNICQIDSLGNGKWIKADYGKTSCGANGKGTFNQYSYYTNAATNGSDGCCGDDQLAQPGTCQAKTDTCSQYTDLSSCTTAGCQSTTCSTQGCSAIYTDRTVSGLNSDCLNLEPAACDSGEVDMGIVNGGTTNCCYSDDPSHCETGAVYDNRVCRTYTKCYDSSIPGDCNTHTIQSDCIAASGCTWNADPLASGFNFDYGYIDSTQKYMCYNYAFDTSLKKNSGAISLEEWSWLDAKPYGIDVFTLNNNGKTTDVISNGVRWFYCNANKDVTSGLAGVPINESQSFKSEYGVNNISCVDAMSNIFNHQFAATCPLSNRQYCCVGLPGSPFVVDVGSVSECANICYGPTEDTKLNLDCDPNDNIRKHFCPDITGPTEPTFSGDGNSQKSACNYDLTGCINDAAYSKDKSCVADLKGTICSTGLTCVNGIDINTTDPSLGHTTPWNNGCCFNPTTTAICKDTSNTNVDTDCTNNGGTLYNPSLANCYGASTPIGGDPSNMCCFYTVIPRDYSRTSWYNKVSPDPFICFKQDNNNIIAQCTYDNASINSDKLPGNLLDDSAGRVRSVGTQLNTVLSFDSINVTNGAFIDNVRVMSLSSAGKTSDLNTWVDPSIKKYLLLHYSYLEFDIAFTAKGQDMGVTLETINSAGTTQNAPIDLGPLAQYLPTGNTPRRWHHAIIDLNKIRSQLQSDALYYAIVFYDSPNDRHTIAIDSITLTPNTASDLQFNSANEFCTGGFSKWIDGLNPPIGTNFTNWNSYGPYEYACEAQGPYDWTGHYCCGYNTKFNYGEFYNDTSKGCFDGSKIMNNWAVSYINNVQEGTAAFESYTYRDLMYFNNTFVGCQVRLGKYADLNVSYDGTGRDALGHLLIQDPDTVNAQCGVVGSYYCANGAWRKTITIGSGQMDFGGQALTLKTTPSGSELIKNGGFVVSAPTCTDGIKNQGESDIDCGGPCGPTCVSGKTCDVNSDCQATHTCANLGGASTVCI